jgi:quinol monooxygenase YgiN
VHASEAAYDQQVPKGEAVFVVTYSYKVPKSGVKAHLNLQKKVKAIYLKHGCLSYEVFENANGNGEWIEIGRFQNKGHFRKVITQVDKDPEIREFFREFCSIVNVDKNPVITNQLIRRI